VATDTTSTFSIPDPRPRVVSFAVVVASAMVVVTGVAAMTAVLAYVLVLFFAAGRPARELYVHASRLLPFVVIIMVLNGWIVPGPAVVSVGGHGVLSRDGLASGAFFSVRLCVLYMATAVLLATTAPEEFAAAVFAFARPFWPRAAARLAFYGFVSMSFVPLFADELRRVRQAQSFRGGGLSGGFVARVRGTRVLVVPLVVSAVRRSEQLAMVTELRGLKDRLGESLVIGRARAADAALPALTVAVVIGAVVGLR
jgi:energy-coupling factor transport system permease protein